VTLLCGMTWSGAVGWLWANESRFVFRASRSRVIQPVAYPELVQLRTPDGMALDAVALPADQPSPYWILFCPPAAGTIHGRLHGQLQQLRTLGYNVFAFDYRGFGRNDGTPSEAGLYTDARTAYRYLTQTLGVPPDRVILAGRSLGSAVAVQLGTERPSAGLLLLSALDSVPSTANRLYPWAPVSLLASHRFDSLGKAPRVRAPVLLVHGVDDWLIPIEAARALFGRFPGHKQMIETPGGHNRAGLGDQDVAEALRRFWPVVEPYADSE
jgi:uncharacterized protein